MNKSMEDNLGIVIDKIENGFVQAFMPVDERTCQPYGYLNGGASAALAEIIAGHGSIALCTDKEIACGVHLSADHISMVQCGESVRAEAKLIHQGRSRHIWNVEIFSEKEKLVSTIKVVNQIIKKSDE